MTIPFIEPETTVFPSVADMIDLEVLKSLDDPSAPPEESLMIELIDLYLDETLILLQAIRAGIDSSNWDVVKLKSHSLRGSSSNLGITGMARLSDRMEYFDASGPTRPELMDQLEQEFVNVGQILSEERKRRVDAHTDR
jgi:HPt (histidine-containing phosphotransfer) domain-containing protein